YSVAQRTREIGIRMALGARVGDVLSLVTRQGMTVAGIGLLLGLGGALAAGRLLEALLFDIESTDPVSLGAAALLLAIVAGAAAWLPARRAARVQPMEVLRDE
ncbi:MAG: FtsX-like permease family protein, partial [Gemmatimonadota bacterium]